MHPYFNNFMLQRFVCFNSSYISIVYMFQWFICFNGTLYCDMSVNLNMKYSIFHVSICTVYLELDNRKVRGAKEDESDRTSGIQTM
jgi:hypothetical protein